MPLFSVVLPTYNHCDPIIWAIESVRQQTLQDFEILVVGDGVPDRTRDIIEEFCGKDERIKFFDNPKGESKGEKYRHSAVMAAQGRYIAYIADDDVWHESHLETLERGLVVSDFCQTFHGCVFPSGQLDIFPGDLGKQFCRDVLSIERYNFFGPTCVGHSREKYLQLPHGWRPAPKGTWTDLHMWRQWFEKKDVRYLTVPKLTTIHLDSPGRNDQSAESRAKESHKWLKKINEPGEIFRLEVNALRRLAMNQGAYQYIVRKLMHGTEKERQNLFNSLKAR